jgi:hypothetical protein
MATRYRAGGVSEVSERDVADQFYDDLVAIVDKANAAGILLKDMTDRLVFMLACFAARIDDDEVRNYMFKRVREELVQLTEKLRAGHSVDKAN